MNARYDAFDKWTDTADRFNDWDHGPYSEQARYWRSIWKNPMTHAGSEIELGAAQAASSNWCWGRQ